MLDTLKGLFRDSPPTPESQATVEYDDFDDLYETAREARLPLEKVWLENLAFYMGEHWLVWNPETRIFEVADIPAWRVHYTGNLIKPNIRTEYAKLIQSRPTARVKPMSDEPDDIKRARTNNQFLDFNWKPSGSEEAKNESLLWALIMGTGLIKRYWDPDAGPVLSDPERGINIPLGEIAVYALSPFELYPEPLAKTIKECNYVFHVKLRTQQYVQDKYGIEVPDDDFGNSDHLEGRIAQITDQGVGAKMRGVMVAEMWQRPTKKYPQGRFIVKGGDKLLEARENPGQKPLTQVPFVHWQHIRVPGRFWGSSVIDDLKDPQRNYNKTHSQIIESRNLVMKPKVLVPIGCLPAGKQISSAPGEVIDYTPINGQKPEIMLGANVPESVWRDLEQSTKEIREISGIHEVTNADVPGQVRAYRAIAALQEQDDARMVPAAMSFETAIADLEGGKLALARQYYDEPRVLRVMGEGNRTEVTDFMKDDVLVDADIQVDAGSSMPMTKSAKLAILDRMWELGVVRDPSLYARVTEFGEIKSIFEAVQMDIAQGERENDKMKGSMVPDSLGQTAPPMPLPVNDYDSHIVHIDTHNKFRKSEEYENLDPQIKLIFQQHVEEHRQQVMLQQMASASLGGGGEGGPPGGGGQPNVPSAAPPAQLS